MARFNLGPRAQENKLHLPLFAVRRTRRHDTTVRGGAEGETHASATTAASGENANHKGVLPHVPVRQWLVSVPKRVRFFLMRAVGGRFRDRDQEMDAVRWFLPAEAEATVAHDNERVLVRRAGALLGGAAAEP